MDLFLLVRSPGRMLMGKGISEKLLQQQKLRSGEMLWWAQSDILCTQKREFVGVVLYGGEAEEETAARFASLCDPDFVHFYPPGVANQMERHRALAPNALVLELRWSRQEPTSVKVAQLDECWYYRTSEQADDDFPCAWGYEGIDQILAGYDLTIPESERR